jgi:PEGA domain
MCPSLIRLAVSLPLFSVLFHLPALLPQFQGFSSGKLVIQSAPTGANIVINRQTMSQQTNAAFVVSPGDYSVSVSGNASCAEKSFPVSSGGTTTITCAKGTWQQ